jgi:acyl-CoA dehydrogenase
MADEIDDILSEFGDAVNDQIEALATDPQQLPALDRAIAESLGGSGYLGTSFPEEDGGLGRHDLRFGIALRTACARAGAVGLGIGLGEISDVAMPLLARRTTSDQRSAKSDRLRDGTAIVAVAGLGGGVTVAADGDGWLLDGGACHVINAPGAEFLIVAAETPEGEWVLVLLDPAAAQLTIEPVLDLIGPSGLGVASVSFEGVRATPDDVLSSGQEAAQDVASAIQSQEVLLAAGALADAQRALDLTRDYVRGRQAFGQAIADFQNTGLLLGDVDAEIAAGTAMLERTIAGSVDDSWTLIDTGRLRLHAVATLLNAVDTGVQLHGGYGYMMEYPIATAYLAAPTTVLLGARAANDIRASIGLPPATSSR